MEIYIKDMEMPKSCSDCPMLDWDLDYIKCKVTGRHFKVKEEPFGARRVDDCPLISVPEPHGRLIDADDALIWFVCEGQRSKRYKIGERWELNFEEINKVISSLQTIIPASQEAE